MTDTSNNRIPSYTYDDAVRVLDYVAGNLREPDANRHAAARALDVLREVRPRYYSENDRRTAEALMPLSGDDDCGEDF